MKKQAPRQFILPKIISAGTLFTVLLFSSNTYAADQGEIVLENSTLKSIAYWRQLNYGNQGLAIILSNSLVSEVAKNNFKESYYSIINDIAIEFSDLLCGANKSDAKQLAGALSSWMIAGQNYMLNIGNDDYQMQWYTSASNLAQTLINCLNNLRLTALSQTQQTKIFNSLNDITANTILEVNDYYNGNPPNSSNIDYQEGFIHGALSGEISADLGGLLMNYAQGN